jgi:hypothetical protein
LAREDLEHVLKYGTSLHGEVFCLKVRLRRAEYPGDKVGILHPAPLPKGRIPC